MPVLKELKGPALLLDDRVLVARVGGSQKAGGDLQDAQPDGHEHFRLVAVAEQFVGLFQDGGRAALLPGEILQDPLGKHHKEGGRYPLSADVRYDQAQVVFVHEVKVVEVTTHVPGRVHGGEEVDLRPVREGREDMGKDAALDLSGRGQFLNDPFLFPDQVLLLHLLPFHAADGVHLIVEGQAGTVDLPLHGLELPDGEGGGGGGLQLAPAHADDAAQKDVELAHELSQPEVIDGKAQKKDQARNGPYGSADAPDDFLKALHGDLPDQGPGGRGHGHGEGTYGKALFIAEDLAAVALPDQLFRIRAGLSAGMIDLTSVFGKDMPDAALVLQGGELLLKDGNVYQHESIAVPVAYVHGFPCGGHQVLRGIRRFESVEDRPGNGAGPDGLPSWRIHDLLPDIPGKGIVPRVVQKELPFREGSEEAPVLPHEEKAEDPFAAGDLRLKIFLTVDPGVDQVCRSVILEPDIGFDPFVRHDGPGFGDGGCDQGSDRAGDGLKARCVQLLLLPQGHAGIGTGKYAGQHGDDQKSHAKDRQQHAAPERFQLFSHGFSSSVCPVRRSAYWSGV